MVKVNIIFSEKKNRNDTLKKKKIGLSTEKYLQDNVLSNFPSKLNKLNLINQ